MKQKSFSGFTKLAVVIMAAILLTTGTGILSAKAEVPYNTYTINGNGDTQQTQTAYLPYETITKFGELSLNGPSDMCVTDDGEIYIADTGNSRIVVGNLKGELIRVIGEGTLKTPKGVFVTGNGHVYVADRDAEAVFEFSGEGELLNRYGRPSSPLYGAENSYLPIKVVVNEGGTMFIICESNTNGIVEIVPTDGGTFIGYFGTNFASKSIRTIIYRAILTAEQRARMVSNLPATPDNLGINEKGLIYTVTRGDGNDTIKLLNISGTNIYSSKIVPAVPTAITAGNHDNVIVVTQKGYIYELNREGELLFVFGGSDDGTQRVGLSQYIVAADVDKDDRIYLLDFNANRIQVYSPTEFTSLLHEALYLYSKGRYTESKTPLEEVLKMNSMYTYANKAMGRAFYQEENYDAAMKYARIAKDKVGYSDAFWDIRNQWLKRNIVAVVLTLVAIWLAASVLGWFDRRKQILAGPKQFVSKAFSGNFISHVKFAWRYMRHPLDGSYELSRRGMASLSAANFLLVVGIVEFILNKYVCGFLNKTVSDGKYEIFQDAFGIILVLLVVTACHYLVCTINDGESTIKKIYCYFVFSFAPYITFTPVIFVLSYMVTNNEMFLIQITQLVMWTWVAVLAFIGIKEVNNYSVKETVKVIALTLFTILIVALLVFIIYVLWAQVIEFVMAIIGEVVYRLGY